MYSEPGHTNESPALSTCRTSPPRIPWCHADLLETPRFAICPLAPIPRRSFGNRPRNAQGVAQPSIASSSSNKPIAPPLRASHVLRTRSRSAFYGLANLAHRALLCLRFLRFLRFLRLPAPFRDCKIWRTAALCGTRISHFLGFLLFGARISRICRD